MPPVQLSPQGCQSLSPTEMILFQACRDLGKAWRNFSSLNVLYRASRAGVRLLDFKFTEENNGKKARAPTGYVGVLNERCR